MTMLSAQPLTLTGEQHDRLWQVARALREHIISLAGPKPADAKVSIALEADAIERILIDAQDAHAAGSAAS